MKFDASQYNKLFRLHRHIRRLHIATRSTSFVRAAISFQRLNGIVFVPPKGSMDLFIFYLFIFAVIYAFIYAFIYLYMHLNI